MIALPPSDLELEVEGQTGAAYREKNPERLAQRNG
ncbi:hypothetical protein FBZ94_11413 [Bradyrhizobium sacchari]|uniref:Uncharacterized protein n=2 Tax=Bradyrhizobium sacchari TaxID=1399419 RepID=A0A560J9M4_9BRAD|nr:hypothetical protein FBZ94_11413 [Bradyrhizobium sacchari]TWB67892.1 hypothetical protein FBZ95_11313 [Bradyrhizobium sacchari]